MNKIYLLIRILSRDFLLQSRWNKRDWISSPEATQNPTKYISNSFQNTEYLATRNSDSWETGLLTEGALWLPQFTAWRELSGCGVTWGNLEEPSGLLNQRDGAETLGRPKELKFIRQNAKERASCKENSRNLQKFSCNFLAVKKTIKIREKNSWKN